MSFYDDMASTSSRLISRFGQIFMLVREVDSIDPVTGVNTEGATRRYQVNGLLKTYPDNLIDGTRIKHSDRLIILDAKLEPLLTDKIRIQNNDWNIENIKASSPAGVALVYFVQVRK